MHQQFNELRAKDIRIMNGCIARLSECEDFSEIGEQSVVEMMKLLETDNVCHNHFSSDFSKLLEYYQVEPYVKACQSLNDAFNTQMQHHPVLSAVGWEGIANRTAKMSEFISDRSLAENPLYKDAYRHIDAKRQLCRLIGVYNDKAIALTVNRNSYDYTKREQQIVEVYARMLKNTLTNLSQKSKIKSSLNTIYELLSDRLPADGFEQLTSSELEILDARLSGKRIIEVAKLRGVKPNTISKQSQSMCEKLGVTSTSKLVSLLSNI